MGMAPMQTWARGGGLRGRLCISEAFLAQGASAPPIGELACRMRGRRGAGAAQLASGSLCIAAAFPQVIRATQCSHNLGDEGTNVDEPLGEADRYEEHLSSGNINKALKGSLWLEKSNSSWSVQLPIPRGHNGSNHCLRVFLAFPWSQ